MVNRNIHIIVIGGSAGSFPVIQKILSGISGNFNIPIVLCLHRLKYVKNGFVEALNIRSNKEVIEPEDKEKIKSDYVYLAPANYHILAELNGTVALSIDDMVKYSRPSIDVCFESFSYSYRHKMLGIILSGANTDGAEGATKAFRRGSTIIVQSPDEATIKTMPEAVLKLNSTVKSLTTAEIIAFMNSLVQS